MKLDFQNKKDSQITMITQVKVNKLVIYKIIHSNSNKSIQTNFTEEHQSETVTNSMQLNL
jgi:hypothetical protein